MLSAGLSLQSWVQTWGSWYSLKLHVLGSPVLGADLQPAPSHVKGVSIFSLAEVNKLVVERYPLLDSKPALMRAFKQTTVRDADKR